MSISGIGQEDLEKLKKDMENHLEKLSKRLHDTNEQLKDKVNKEEIPLYTTEKVNKSELTDYMPDMESFELKLKAVIRDEAHELESKLFDVIRNWDTKLVNLRKELNVDSISKLIA